MWEGTDPRGKELIRHRLTTADDFAFWAQSLHQQHQGDLAEIAANGVLVLLNVARTLLDRQITAQAAAFQKEGGFTERLYRYRKNSKDCS